MEPPSSSGLATASVTKIGDSASRTRCWYRQCQTPLVIASPHRETKTDWRWSYGFAAAISRNSGPAPKAESWASRARRRIRRTSGLSADSAASVNRAWPRLLGPLAPPCRATTRTLACAIWPPAQEALPSPTFPRTWPWRRVALRDPVWQLAPPRRKVSSGKMQRFRFRFW